MFVFSTVNCRYINKVVILKIMKTADENEEAKCGRLMFLVSGICRLVILFQLVVFPDTVRSIVSAIWCKMGQSAI